MKVSTLIEFDKLLGPHKARLIRGPTGIGKSSIIKSIADSANAVLIDLRLPELEPTDLVGLPYLSDKGSEKVTRYAMPHWWPTNTNQPIMLFLDEVDRASEDMQPIAMQLCLDRKAGGRDLPDNVTVWAACNGEKYMTVPLDQALIDRFAVIDLMPSIEEWLDWARDANIHDSVIRFIDGERSRLDTPSNLIGKANHVCPSRRSWAEFGLMLNNVVGPLSQEETLSEYARAFVGLVDAEAFTRYVRETYKSVSAQHIMLGLVKPIDLNILQVTSILDETVQWFMRKKTPDSQRKNCLDFFMGATDEVFAAFFAALPASAGFFIETFPEADAYFKSKRAMVLEQKDV